jgi:hypothetical protein
MKKLIGMLFLFYPITISLVFINFDTEFFWYLDDNYKIFDLLYSLLSFIIFCTGIILVNFKVKDYLIFAFSLLFVFYQTMIWGIEPQRFMTKLSVNKNIDVVIKSYDAGATTTNGIANLEVYERNLFFIVKRNTFKSYDNVRSGKLNFANNKVKIELVDFDGVKVSENYFLNELIP